MKPPNNIIEIVKIDSLWEDYADIAFRDKIVIVKAPIIKASYIPMQT